MSLTISDSDFNYVKNVFERLCNNFTDCYKYDTNTVYDITVINLYRLLFVMSIGSCLDSNVWEHVKTVSNKYGFDYCHLDIISDKYADILACCDFDDNFIKTCIRDLSFINSFLNDRRSFIFILGSIYEKLLGYKLISNNVYYSLVRNNQNCKLSGSYYTPDDVVNYIVNNTVAKKLDDLFINRNFTNFSDFCSFVDNNVLKIKIIDSSMGVGYFLIKSVFCIYD